MMMMMMIIIIICEEQALLKRQTVKEIPMFVANTEALSFCPPHILNKLLCY
jgi:hypothetical protein